MLKNYNIICDIFVLFWVSCWSKRCRLNPNFKFNPTCQRTILVNYNSGQGLTHITVDLSSSKKKKRGTWTLIWDCFAKLLVPSSRTHFSELSKVQGEIKTELTYQQFHLPDNLANSIDDDYN